MKKEQDVCILAHAYQSQDILEVADYMGDSYGLSVQASKSRCKNVIMCGVRFMAETCKVLSPQKRVWLANPIAGCPMAEQLDLEFLRALKQKYPDHAVVAYINTTSELKTECDVCVTSSSAVEICKKLDADKILFVPDPNLGHYVAEQIPRERICLLYRRMSTPYDRNTGTCQKSKRASSERIASGASGVSSRSGRPGRLCWFYYWYHELCEEFRVQRIYYRNREQYRRAFTV